MYAEQKGHKNMKTNRKKTIILGALLIGAFSIWTILIQTIDVQAIGVNETNIGFATFNSWFHSLTGVNMTLYIITDWLGVVPAFIGMYFGLMGLVQWIQRRNILKVDFDIIILGVYYYNIIYP